MSRLLPQAAPRHCEGGTAKVNENLLFLCWLLGSPCAHGSCSLASASACVNKHHVWRPLFSLFQSFHRHCSKEVGEIKTATSVSVSRNSTRCGCSSALTSAETSTSSGFFTTIAHGTNLQKQHISEFYLRIRWQGTKGGVFVSRRKKIKKAETSALTMGNKTQREAVLVPHNFPQVTFNHASDGRWEHFISTEKKGK